MTLKETVRRALEEDIGAGDITTAALIPADKRYKAAAAAKESGVVCGVEAAKLAFTLLSRAAKVETLKADGEPVSPGDVILRVEGDRSILSAERVALNFLQHLSGIATLTARFVKAAQGTTAVILDTRKTVPGLRELEKYAVKCGGGVCHRMGLYDAALVKDNHIRAAGWPRIKEAVEKLRKRPGVEFIEIEAQSLEEVKLAAGCRPDIILLDNLSLSDIKKAVRFIGTFPQAVRPQVEISGGVSLKNVRAYAETGADRISVGRLTHSAPALDISLEICDDDTRK
ncbi:MAG: carboxylating nicotinate-nucleotide diphosphorylase [Elusimicrobiales bacterium]|nr:carboxylating nicotinate-nucleotide diphosphorylase [Elusimicrobiales bacterium]